MVGIQARESPVSNAQFAEFRTSSIPGPCRQERSSKSSGDTTNQMEFTVWSVRIRMPHGGSYAYEIRERMISWRPIGGKESDGGGNRRRFGGFERPRYFRELQDARKKDEATRKPNP